MSNKPPLSEEDKAIFRDAVLGVKPIIINKVAKPPPKPQKRKRAEAEIPADWLQAPFSDHEYLPLVSSDELIAFNRPGIQHKTLRKLRLGQYNVEGILDLHGMSVATAKEALHFFIMRSLNNNVRLVLIIHGKGRLQAPPILKNKINHWLRQTPNVLAFCSASHKGAGGALYVLLKSQIGESSFDK